MLSEELPSFLVVRQLHQKVENVVSTCVPGFVVLPEARVVVVLLHVSETNFGVPVEIGLSLVTVNHVTSEPLIESHSAHDVVIGHGVKTIESSLDFLFGT